MRRDAAIFKDQPEHGNPSMEASMEVKILIIVHFEIMAKSIGKKPKPRANKYEEKLSIRGTYADVFKAVKRIRKGERMSNEDLTTPKWLKFLLIVVAFFFLYKILFHPTIGNPDRPPSFRVK